MDLICSTIQDEYHIISKFGCAYGRRIKKVSGLEKIIEEVNRLGLKIKVEREGNCEYIEIYKQRYSIEEDREVVNKINKLIEKINEGTL